MSDDHRKKQRCRAKREEKRELHRRAPHGNSMHRAKPTIDQPTCYINRDWRDQGLASIAALCPLPTGGFALGCFLVDRYCLGLKEVFGNINTSAAAFHQFIDKRTKEGTNWVPCDPSLVRRLVSAAVRWSHDHQFRLPESWKQWTAILGGVNEWPSADVSDFGKDGKLWYIGEIEDLEKRLIDLSVEQFLARGNEINLSPAAQNEAAESTIEEKRERTFEDMDGFRTSLLNKTRVWCFTHDKLPSSRLPAAVDIFTKALIAAWSDPSGAEQNQADAVLVSLQQSLLGIPLETRLPLEEAIIHILSFIKEPGQWQTLMTTIPGVTPPEKPESGQPLENT